MESEEINFAVWQEDESEEEEEEESDDEDYDIPGQALPVQPFDINSVDENSIPLTAQEYLQQVIAQRAKLPAIVTASVPKHNTVSSDYSHLIPEEKIEKSEHSPSTDWQQKKIAEFSDLRYRVDSNRNNWTGSSINFPTNKAEWYQYMFENGAKNEVQKQEPYLDIILRMDNETIVTLIKYVVEWTTDGSLSIHEAGKWFFALLACVDVPLAVPTTKKLRVFALKCRDLRKKIDLSVPQNEAELTAQNLFVCLIGKYFGQRDLADD